MPRRAIRGGRRIGVGSAIAALAMAVALVVPLGPAGAAPAWSVVATPSPNPGNGGVLNGVSCVSANSCKAVGYYFRNSTQRTFVRSWNGHVWTIVASPNRGQNDSNTLTGVSCIAANSCKAVGYSRGTGGVWKTLIESWNGQTWTLVNSPIKGTASNVLNAVSCVSANSCIAVGYAGAKTLVESWNGHAWKLVASPSSGTVGNGLLGVSCTSASACSAVGYAGAKTLVESWNGSAWTIVASPNRGTPPHSNRLESVSCLSPTSCRAVGTDRAQGGANKTLVESWNGHAWTIVASPSPGSSANDLHGVSCKSATSCQAVGNSGTHTLVESWNGSAWSVAASPSPGTQINVLSAVSCTSATSCTAVGHRDYLSLVERYA